MENVDLELKLLAGDEIQIENLGTLKPLTLKEIKDIGIYKYYSYLQVLCFEVSDLSVDANNQLDMALMLQNNITTFDMILANCIKATNEEERKNFAMLVEEALSCFFRQKARLFLDTDNDISFFYLNDEEITIDDLINISENNQDIDDKIKIINKQNYELIKTILKKQNVYRIINEKDDENPANAKAKEILEKRKKMRDKVAKSKSKTGNDEEEGLTLFDLISILASNANGINIFNVWDLTMFQFNDQFNRMKLLDEYDINIRSLLAGAKQEDMDFKHWMSKLKN